MSLSITKVLLLDNVDPSAKTILEENGVQAMLCSEKLSQSDLIKKLQDFDTVVVRSATAIPEEVIKACPKLSVIGRAGTGVDNIDVKCATRHGIVVMNTPNGNTISAAEHTCTLMCAMARNVPAADAHVKLGKWERKLFMGQELYGKTLGIIGLGRIGLEVARRMQSFGVKTIGYDPIVSAEDAKVYDIDWMNLESIWTKADYITVHTPLIPQTRGLINSQVFAKCKKGVKVINCARGGIIDEECLLKALESGQCGGAGLDVFVDEPTKNTALISHPRVIACPHLGASTKEAQARCGSDIAQQLVDAKNNKSFFGILNAPALTALLVEGANTWIDVAGALGKILKRFMKDEAKFAITSRTFGDGLSKLGTALNAAICTGLVDGKCNLINAQGLLIDNGMQVQTSHQKHDQEFCELEGKFGDNSLCVIGKVIGNMPILFGINGMYFKTPTVLKGSMIFYRSSQKYNILKVVVGVLTDEGIVIETMSSTQSEGDKWVVMALDKDVSNISAITQRIDAVIAVNI